MAEKSGKVGAFYATSGLGKPVVAEKHILAASGTWLDQKNVMVSNVYVGSADTSTEHTRWYCTPMGHLTILDAGATAYVQATYRWWAEIGKPGTASGIIKQYGGFFNWSIDETCDVVEKTNFQDSGHRAYLAALDGWTATAERHWVDSGMKQYMGSKVILKFYVDDNTAAKGAGSDSDTGDRYEGYGYVIGLSPTVAIDALVNESLSFQGTGQLVYES